ncbi:MAG: lysophospholipid acyltransferase family protein [Anaerolineales bacterium]|jgi:1-acyl-sn-glycerol-3-phosphate acyltransferase
MFSRFLRWSFNFLASLLSRREVEGLENLPARGPCILAVNHLSIFDLPLVFGLIGGENVTGWAAEKYARHPFFGPILRMGNAIFIERGQVDRHAIEAAVAWVKRGNMFGIAPEGTRSRTGAMARAKTGIAYLASEVDVPIVPIAVAGTEATISCWLRLRRPRFLMRIGQPFKLPPLDEANRSASLRANADEVMCRIAILLAPEYRGYYADHPRLKELLAASSR